MQWRHWRELSVNKERVEMRIILTFLYTEIICRPLHFDCCIIPHTHQHSYFVSLRCCTANVVYLQHAELSSTASKTHWATAATPSSSVDSKLLRFFPGHAAVLQVALHGIYPINARSSWLSLYIAWAPEYGLSWLSFSLSSIRKKGVPAISAFFLLW